MKRIGLGLCAIVLSSCGSMSSYSPKRYSDDFAIESCEQPPKPLYESSASIIRLQRLFGASLRLSSLVSCLENNHKKYGLSEEDMVLYRDVAGFKERIQHRLLNIWNDESGNVKSASIEELTKIKNQEQKQVPIALTQFMADAIPNAIKSFATNAWQYSDFLYAEGGDPNWLNNDPLMRYLFDKYNLFNRE